MKASILAITVLIYCHYSFAQSYDPTDDLFFAFGSKCKGKGPINNMALNDGAGLKAIIENIRSDNACKGLTGVLSDIESLNIPQLLNERLAKDDLEYMSMQAMDLELAIKMETEGATSDSKFIAALKSELVETKVNIVKSQKLSNQEKTRKRLETIDNFQRYSALLFSRLKQSDECFSKKPNLSAQIGSQVLGLGSTLASGLVGSLMLATGNLIDNLVSFIRERNVGKNMKTVTNNRIGEAVGCSFEGLSHTYCQARDVETIINFNQNNNARNSRPPSWLDGIGIIGQDVQSYIDWVTQVDAGTPAGTGGRAADKKAAFAGQHELKMAKTDLDGVLNEEKQALQQSANKAEATRTAINRLGAMLQPKNVFTGSTSIVTGPFLNSFPEDSSCGPYVYLYSKGVNRKREDVGTIPCTTYVSTKYPNPPSIETEIGILIENLVTEATQYNSIRASLVTESNPLLVLSKVDAKAHNRRSAREFLDSAVVYLKNILNDPRGIAQKPTQKELIIKTKQQIETSLAIIDRTEDPPDSASKTKKSADPRKKVTDLSKELIPQGDTLAVPKALSEIINQDIDNKIGQGQLDENVAILMQLSANGGLAELIKYYIGLQAASTQARSAKLLSKANLTALGGVFSDNLEQHMKKLSKEANSDPDAYKSLALLCMQSLAVPESPKIGDNDVGQYCSGKIYHSSDVESGLKMDYNELSAKSYPDKACAVYDFYRKSYLYDLKSSRGLPSSQSGAK